MLSGMHTFLTLTPNPALDIATATERVQPTHKLRCGPVQRYPGGGGINVARVLHRLGASVQAHYLAGGPNGEQLERLLAALRTRLDICEDRLVETGAAIGAHAGPGALIVAVQPVPDG